MGHNIRVKFQGGREVTGILKGFDKLLNLVLDETIEYIRGEPIFVRLFRPIATMTVARHCRMATMTVNHLSLSNLSIAKLTNLFHSSQTTRSGGPFQDNGRDQIAGFGRVQRTWPGGDLTGRWYGANFESIFASRIESRLGSVCDTSARADRRSRALMPCQIWISN